MPASIRKRHRRQQRAKRLRIVSGVLVFALGLGLSLPFVAQWGREQYAIAQMRVQQAAGNPSPAPMRTESPPPTPTLTSTPTVATLDWRTWPFRGATLSAPAAQIVDAPIHEILPEEFVKKTVFDADNNAVGLDMVNPNNKHVLTWYTINANGVRSFPEGGIISGQTQGPIVLYCHNYRDGTAVCSFTKDFVPGDTIVITTATEILTYRLEQVHPVLKTDVEANGLLQNGMRGDLFIITCDSQGGYTSSNEAMSNSLLHFEFVSSSRR